MHSSVPGWALQRAPPPLAPPAPPPRFLQLLKSGTDPARYGGSLYLAYGGDATLSQQRYEAARADSKTASLEPWQRASPDFAWNRALAQPLLGEGAAAWGSPRFACSATASRAGAPPGLHMPRAQEACLA